jgi:tetratricopeptide (TPR) repeat protein
MHQPNGTAAQHGFAGRGAVLALVLLLTLAAFGGGARNGFVNYDDPDYLTANPVVAQGVTAAGIAWAFGATAASNWHPLTWLSHELDVELFGMHPGAHHLVSLALHAANVALLFLALTGLTGARWRSALVAALFAVHPLHVESVAWAAERKDVLSTLFALAALLAYVRAARRGRVLGSVATPLLFLLALLAKPMPVSLPFVLLLLDGWPLGRWAPGGARGRLLPPAALWREKVPLFVLAAASATVTLLVQRAGGAMDFGGSLPLAHRALSVVRAYAFYARAAVWPVDLAVFYPYPVVAPPWWLWAGELAALAAATAILLAGARRRPALAVGWLWFLGTLVPVIGVVPVGYQGWADRYAYLPLAGLFIAAAWVLEGLWRARPAARAPLVVVTGAALLGLAGLTAAQVARWRDDRTLYRHAIAATGGTWLAWNLLGNAAADEGDLGGAVAAYREAARLAREQGAGATVVGFNLAAALHAQGNTREAAEEYRALLRRDSRDRDALNNLGSIALEEGRAAEAAELFRRALAVDPRFAAGHGNLGRALAAKGDLEGAARHWGAALALDPQDAAVRSLLEGLRSRPGGRAPPP